MRVLFRGPFMVFVCRGCRSVLKSESDDVQCSPAWEGAACGGDEFFFVACPVCGVKRVIDLERRILSDAVIANARNDARREEPF